MEPLSARSSSSNSLLKPLPCSIVELPDTTSVGTWQGLEAGSLDLPDWVGECLIGSVDGTLTLRAAIIHYRGTTVTDPGGGGNAQRHIMIGGGT